MITNNIKTELQIISDKLLTLKFYNSKVYKERLRLKGILLNISEHLKDTALTIKT